MAERTLPSEVIAEILSRLPVKPLCRFKSVSKPWNSLINSPNFIKLHLSKTLISDEHPNLIFSSFCISAATIAPDFRFTELRHPLLDFPDCRAAKIIGSCNGVVCISPFHKAYACMYNPTIGTHFLLPPTPSRFPQPNREAMALNHYVKSEGHEFFYGFGYDSVRDDYKLLRILEYYRNSVFVGIEVCLYSLKNNSWKYVDVADNVYLNGAGLQNRDGVLFNEGLYFAVNNGKLRPCVRCFNLQTETFSIMDLPKFDEKLNLFSFGFGLGQVGGRLSCLLNHRNVEHVALRDVRLIRAEFWTMKEEGWVRLFSINDMSSIGSLDIKPLVYSKDGKKILLQLDGCGFGWYDWEKGSIVRVSVHGLPRKNAPFDTWTYVESLVSLGNRNYNLKGKTTVPQKKRKKDVVDRFLSSGFKLKL